MNARWQVTARDEHVRETGGDNLPRREGRFGLLRAPPDLGRDAHEVALQ
jgi:hypothetical protein